MHYDKTGELSQKTHKSIAPTVVAITAVPPPSLQSRSNLLAPIAYFEEGFSSDGAFISEAETEIEVSDFEGDAKKRKIKRSIEKEPFLQIGAREVGMFDYYNYCTKMYGAPLARKGRGSPRTFTEPSKFKETDSCATDEEDPQLTPQVPRKMFHDPSEEESMVAGKMHKNVDQSQKGFEGAASGNSAKYGKKYYGSATVTTSRSFSQDGDEELILNVLSGQNNSINDPEEARTSLLNQQESLDDQEELDQELSAIERHRVKVADVSRQKPPSALKSNFDPSDQQVRKEFEKQAVNRPRCTTPVSACTIEGFIMTAPSHDGSSNDKLKISLPGQQEEMEEGQSAQKSKKHQRKSSKSWSEFCDNMWSSGLTSGRTTPISSDFCSNGLDMFETNPAYQHKVPPSPVVHRRTSTDWVDFGAAGAIDFSGSQIEAPKDGFLDNSSAIPQAAAAFSASIAALSFSADDFEISSPPTQPKVKGQISYRRVLDHNTDANFSFDASLSDEISSTKNASAAVFEKTSDDDDWVPPPTLTSTTATSTQAQRPQPTTAIATELRHAPVWASAPTTLPATVGVGVALPFKSPPAATTTTTQFTVDTPLSEYPIGKRGSEEVAVRDYDNFMVSLTSSKDGATDAAVAEDVADFYGDSPSYSDSQPPHLYDDWRRPPAEHFPHGQPANEGTYAANNLGDNMNNYETYPEPPSVANSWDNQKYESNFNVVAPVNPVDFKIAEPTAFHMPYTPPAVMNSPWNEAWDNDATEIPSAFQKTVPQNKADVVSLIMPQPVKPPHANHENIPPAKTAPKTVESTENTSEWSEYLKLSDRVTQIAKETQIRLKEMDKTSITKTLPTTPSEVAMAHQSAYKKQSVDEIMQMSQDSPQNEGEKEWKPIHQRLNEEIQKERELLKPKRPPLPKGSAKRPPQPSQTTAAPNIQPNWDDENSLPPPPPCFLTSPKISPVNLMATRETPTVPPALSENLATGPTFPAPPPEMLLHDLDETFGFVTSSKGSMVGPAPLDPVTNETAGKMPDTTNWWGFDEKSQLPASDSGFFQNFRKTDLSPDEDPFARKKDKLLTDLLGPDESASSYDPFEVKPVEQVMADVKQKTQALANAQEAQDDVDFFGSVKNVQKQENLMKKDSEVLNIERDVSSPLGFNDQFTPMRGAGEESRTPSPLFDEDDSLPLDDFPPKFTGNGWELMLRYPVKKKMIGERCWKAVFVKLDANCVQLFYSKTDKRPFQEVPLLANYNMSDVTLQQYDIYGKIHTAKLQVVLYKERVGVRPGQIPKLVEGKLTKLGLPVEHAAQSTALLKFGCLNKQDLQTFVNEIEDVLFRIGASREQPSLYKQDEIQVHCYDEYTSQVSKTGLVTNQRARVRLFCLAFLTGDPLVEIGLNDRRRQGKEVVRRKDIMPMYTERWIRLEALQFHSTVDQGAYDRERMIRLKPLDACVFETLRFRVRPPKGKELPLQVLAVMKIAGSKIEIRLEIMVSGFKSRKAHQVPCEDIQVRFPIPEAWIYLFREEKHWGYGSVHAKVRRPGKVKNIKDKLMGIVQHTETSLIEAAIGDAKYEHVYRALVWRIPKLPEKHHEAYKTHLLRCRFELNSFDLMPETFTPILEVEHTMPITTVSHTVVRSVSIEQHEDPDRVEKWVRYVAKFHYKVEIDYVQTTDLDMDAVMDSKVLEPEKSLEKTPAVHKSGIDVEIGKEVHAGYRIDFKPGEFGESESNFLKQEKVELSSSDSDDEKDARKFPVVSIDMKGYGY